MLSPMDKKPMDGRRLKHEVLTEFRKRAVARVQSGESPEVVVRAMGFSRACIYNWLAMYRAGGWDALDARKRGGRPRKVKGRMLAWIYRTVVGKDPRHYRFPFALWTRNAIAAVIYQKYGIRLSANSVGRLLAQLGITPQRPCGRRTSRIPRGCGSGSRRSTLDREGSEARESRDLVRRRVRGAQRLSRGDDVGAKGADPRGAQYGRTLSAQHAQRRQSEGPYAVHARGTNVECRRDVPVP